MKEPLVVDTTKLKTNPNYRLVFFDFEVLQFEVMLSLYDIWTDLWLMARGSEPCGNLLKAYLLDPRTVFAGYNNKNYDNMIAVACMEGWEQHEIWQLNRAIMETRGAVLRGEEYTDYQDLRFRFPGVWQFARRAWDCGHDLPPATKLSREGVKIPYMSLKAWQKFNNVSVVRSPIPFDYPLPLNSEQASALGAYNRYDVATTCKIAATTLVGRFQTRCGFADMLPDGKFGWHKTFTKLAAELFVDKPEATWKPEDSSWLTITPKFPKTLRIEKYTEVLRFFDKPLGYLESGGTMSMHVAGVSHTFALGGLHSNSEQGVFKGNIFCLDVSGMYPSLMNLYGLVAQSVNGKKHKDILKQRLSMAKSDPRRDVYKQALNSAYGGMLDKFSSMYDPAKARQVCILGQCFVVDLLERLEEFVDLIQSNTDGIYVIPKNEEAGNKAKAAVKEFENRTGLAMDVEYYQAMYQRDVNNYIAIKADGGEKVRGQAFRSINHAGPTVGQAMNRCEIMGIPFDPNQYSLKELSIVCTRDKNSRGFIVNGEETDAETIDVVPVYPFQGQEIYTMNRDGTTRKARLCPDFAALSSSVSRADIDFAYYQRDRSAGKTTVDEGGD